MSNKTPALEFTGERFVPSVEAKRSRLYFEHIHRYHFCAQSVKGKRVLDIASGEGYGAYLLSRAGAASVIGVDISKEAVSHAQTVYGSAGISFLEGSCDRIPVPEGSVDVVCSFETVEHIEGQEKFLSEVRRVLAPGGVFYVSTPNRDEYQQGREDRNQFHVKELSQDQFVSLIGASFAHWVLCAQSLQAGSRLQVLEAKGDESLRVEHGVFSGGVEESNYHQRPTVGVYCVAVCSDKPVTNLRVGSYEEAQATLEIWDAYERFPVAQMALDLKSDIASANRIIELDAEVQRRGEWGMKLSEEINHLRKVNEAAQVERAGLQDKLNETLRSSTLRLEASRAEYQAKIAELEADWSSRQSNLELQYRNENRALVAKLSGDYDDATDKARAESVQLRSDLTRATLLAAELRTELAIVKADLAFAVDKTTREAGRYSVVLSELEDQLRRSREAESSAVMAGLEFERTRAGYEKQLEAAQVQLAAAMTEAREIALIKSSEDSELADLKARLLSEQNARRDLNSMKSSLSWKVTAPLRWIHNMFGNPLCK